MLATCGLPHPNAIAQPLEHDMNLRIWNTACRRSAAVFSTQEPEMDLLAYGHGP